jgi:hypothetical protein
MTFLFLAQKTPQLHALLKNMGGGAPPSPPNRNYSSYEEGAHAITLEPREQLHAKKDRSAGRSGQSVK